MTRLHETSVKSRSSVSTQCELRSTGVKGRVSGESGSERLVLSPQRAPTSSTAKPRHLVEGFGATRSATEFSSVRHRSPRPSSMGGMRAPGMELARRQPFNAVFTPTDGSSSSTGFSWRGSTNLSTTRLDSPTSDDLGTDLCHLSMSNRSTRGVRTCWKASLSRLNQALEVTRFSHMLRPA